MITKTKYISWLILGLFFLLSGACNKSCQKSSFQKKYISVGLGFPIEGIDPRYTTSAIASRVSKLVYAPLFVLGESLAPEPFLAEKIEPLSDTSFKIILKNNLYFHNKTKITSQDIVYTFSKLSDPDVLSPHAAKFEYIKNIKSLDQHTILFELNKPHAPFLTDLCAIGIVSKKACHNRSQECRHEHIGSGPYKVEKWDSAKEDYYFTPFESWFEGPAKSNLVFRVVRDENTRMLEIMGKKTDIIESDISPQNAKQLKTHDFLDVKQVPGLGYTYLALNVRGPDKTNTKKHNIKTRKALANPLVRSAIAQAIDFEQIIQKLLLGTATRVSGLIPNGHWAKDPELKPPTYDPKEAEKLLDQAGFLRSEDTKIRFNLTISSTPNRMRQSIAQLYADFLTRVGIKTSLRVKDWSALYQDLKAGNFEAVSAIWVPVTEPDLYYWVHHSSNIPTQDHPGGNRHGYKNPKADNLIEMGRVTMNPEKRKLIYQKLEKILLKDLPYIPLWNGNRIVIINNNTVRNYKPQRTGSLMGLRFAELISKN